MNEAWAKVGELELCYERFAGDGPPVLLVMGIGTQMVLWDTTFCERLAAEGFEVIRYDHRDVGRSTWLRHLPPPPPGPSLLRAAAGLPVSAPYSLYDLADDAAGLLEALGHERAHVVGVSMGGMVAQCMAIRHPQRLRSMTSFMSAPGDRFSAVGSPRALKGLLAPAAKSREEAGQRTMELAHLFNGQAHPVDEARAQRLGQLCWDRGVNPAGFLRHLGAILATGDRRKALSDVQVPTMVMHGTQDPLVPPRAGKATAAAIPGARMVWLEGVGHTMPSGTWDQIIAELRDHCRAADGITRS